jgi:monoterpene epsilon-lactone hydrolase
VIEGRRPLRERPEGGHTGQMDDGGTLLSFPQAPDGIELRHLRTFVAVAQELNFGRAAERLYITQPAVSRQIRALEQFMGCELLRRSTHRVTLTIAGEALLDRSRRLLGDVDSAVAATRALGNEHLGRIAQIWRPLEQAAQGTIEDLRVAFEQVNAQFPVPEGVTVRPVRSGAVASLLVSAVPDARPAVVFVHGGGFVAASAYGYRAHAGALATTSGSAVLVPDYRLAPEHPFPAAIDDVQAACEWLADQGTPVSELVLAADSAGASIVLSLLLRWRDAGAELPRSVVLMCPLLDLRERALDASPLEQPTREELDAIGAYLAGRSPEDPLVHPLGADLHGLPPMLVQAATGDGRLRDARALARRAAEHGVKVTLALETVDAHAFQLYWSFLPQAARAMEAAGAFVRGAETASAQLSA